LQKIEQNISRITNVKIAITCNLNYIRLHHNIYAILSMRCRESRCGKGLSAFKVGREASTKESEWNRKMDRGGGRQYSALQSPNVHRALIGFATQCRIAPTCNAY